MIAGAYAWDVRKLLHQWRTYLGFGAVVSCQVNPPKPSAAPDMLAQNFVLRSGFVLPLVVLFYSSLVLLPAAALVAGDIFAAKVLAATYVLAVVVLFALTGLVCGGIAYGFHTVPLPPTAIPPGEAALRIVAAVSTVYAVVTLVIG